jgi:hypothetical protein
MIVVAVDAACPAGVRTTPETDPTRSEILITTSAMSVS